MLHAITMLQNSLKQWSQLFFLLKLFRFNRKTSIFHYPLSTADLKTFPIKSLFRQFSTPISDSHNIRILSFWPTPGLSDASQLTSTTLQTKGRMTLYHCKCRRLDTGRLSRGTSCCWIGLFQGKDNMQALQPLCSEVRPRANCPQGMHLCATGETVLSGFARCSAMFRLWGDNRGV